MVRKPHQQERILPLYWDHDDIEGAPLIATPTNSGAWALSSGTLKNILLLHCVLDLWLINWPVTTKRIHSLFHYCASVSTTDFSVGHTAGTWTDKQLKRQYTVLKKHYWSNPSLKKKTTFWYQLVSTSILSLGQGLEF